MRARVEGPAAARRRSTASTARPKQTHPVHRHREQRSRSAGFSRAAGSGTASSSRSAANPSRSTTSAIRPIRASRTRFGLELDEYGNARKSCSVVYGRKTRGPVAARQKSRATSSSAYITYAETDYTPRHRARASGRRLPVARAVRVAELRGHRHRPAAASVPVRRDRGQDRRRRADRLRGHRGRRDAAEASALARPHALPRQRAEPACRSGSGTRSGWLTRATSSPSRPASRRALRRQRHRRRACSAPATSISTATPTGGFRPARPSIPPNPAAHFYLPIGASDPFGLETIADVRPVRPADREAWKSRRRAWNVVTAVNDYRVLGPVLMTDPNGNRSAVEHRRAGHGGQDRASWARPARRTATRSPTRRRGWNTSCSTG